MEGGGSEREGAMSQSQANEEARELARRVGDVLGREAPDLSSVQAARLAILVARDVANLPPDIAQTAVKVAERSNRQGAREAGRLASAAIWTAWELHDLPGELRGAARIYLGEMAFTADDARRVIDWLESSRLAVIGVELWSPIEDGSIWWLGTSHYEERCETSSWESYVGCCARGARAFVDEWGRSAREHFDLGERAVVFSLMWDSQDESARAERIRRSK